MYPGSKPLRLLLIEDEVSDAKLISEAFKEVSLFAKMNIVEDGQEAIDYLHRAGAYTDVYLPDLILLDLKIPKKDGFQLLEMFKSSSEFKHIPVIILSSETSSTVIQKCYQMNANSFIKKPKDIDGYFDLMKDVENFWLRTAKLPA